MRPTLYFVVSIAVFCVAVSRGADMSIGTNFTVLAPNQAVADGVAAQAEVFRKEAALQWLNETLPDRLGRSLITVEITSQKDEGLTWPIDSKQRTMHQVWLTTSADRAMGSTLHHEVIHTVLDTHFYPAVLPAWSSEGIASQADDDARKEDRRLRAAQWARTGQWPNLAALLTLPRIEHDNVEAYAAASSFTEFLVALGGKPRVLQFAINGQKQGWDDAARSTYRFRNVVELQAAWQAWAAKSAAE